MPFSDYPLSAASVTTIGGKAVTEGMARSDVNDVLRQLAADGRALADEVAAISTGDTFNQLTALEAATARIERMYPPFSEVGDVLIGDVVPTAATPLAAIRLSATWFMVRVRSTTLADVSLDDVYWDEYFFRDPDGYSEVDAGWQLVGHRAYYNKRYSTWFIAPDGAGDIPNADFAIRLGLAANAYHSGGEGPSFYYTGFGHGRAYVDSTAVSILLDGAGSNLQDTANWAVGATITGSTLDITAPFKLRALAATLGANPLNTTNASGTLTINHTGHGFSTGQFIKLESVDLQPGLNGLTYAQLNGRYAITVVNANSYTVATGGTATSTGSGGGSVVQVFADCVDLAYTQSLGTFGLRRKGAYDASIAGFAIQDSYGYMLPVNPYEVTHFKPSDTDAIELVQDDEQKGNWTGGTSLYHQAYNGARDTILCQMYLEYSQPLRKALGGLSAWGQNTFGRYFFRDLGDYGKYYVFINSSEEIPPRTAFTLSVGEVFEWQSLLRTEYRAEGPR